MEYMGEALVKMYVAYSVVYWFSPLHIVMLNSCSIVTFLKWLIIHIKLGVMGVIGVEEEGFFNLE